MTYDNTWGSFLKLYSETNEGRPTRLGVFEWRGTGFSDYWLENGLPLVGIDNDHTKVQIMLGKMTHTIHNAERITFHVSAGHETDGVDVLDSDGTTTVLRFENSGVGV